MRHLMSTGTIDLVDNLLMAYPDQAFMRDVVKYNDEEQVKLFNAEVKGDAKEEIHSEVSALLEEYNNSVLGIMADTVSSGGETFGRASHSVGVMNVIRNVAKGYHFYNRKSPEEAAKIAFDHVIGNNYEFGEVNEMQVRYPSGAFSDTAGMTDILDTAITKNNEYLRTIVSPPPPPVDVQNMPEGLEKEAAIKAFEDNFYNIDMAKFSWRTTTDNSGVYLVDALGNIVPRKRVEMMPADADQQERFVTISFNKLAELNRDVNSFADENSDNFVRNPQLQRKSQLEFILGNQLF